MDIEKMQAELRAVEAELEASKLISRASQPVLTACVHVSKHSEMIAVWPTSAAQDGGTNRTVVRIFRFASWAEIAMPLRFLEDNLRRESALADAVIKQLGDVKFFVLKGLVRLVNLGFKLLQKQVGPTLFFRTPVLSGVDFTKEGDTLPYCDQCLSDLFKHGVPSESDESCLPIRAEYRPHPKAHQEPRGGAYDAGELARSLLGDVLAEMPPAARVAMLCEELVRVGHPSAFEALTQARNALTAHLGEMVGQKYQQGQ